MPPAKPPKMFTTQYPVYRHASDDPAHDCGRACAQMVIASVAFGSVGAGATQPVPESQQSIEQREYYEAAHAGASGPGQWATYPDELVQVLESTPQLGGPPQNVWNVATYRPARGAKPGSDSALQKLLKDIVRGLKRGLPSILNIRSVDHWVVVDTAWVKTSGSVVSIRFVDPVGLPSTVSGTHHTYQDGCGNAQSAAYWMTETYADLAQFQLAVGAYAPTSYKGKYVAVVPGQVTANLTPAEPGPAPAPVSTTRTEIKTSLEDVAAYLGLTDVQALLNTNPEIIVRTVKDVQGSTDTYVIGSLFDASKDQGLIGIFNARTNRVYTFVLTKLGNFHAALKAVPAAEALWWTRRELTVGSSPLYPFRLVSPGKFERLVDRAPLEYR